MAKNRAIIGHNFKIAWNLTRVANYHNALVRSLKSFGGEEQKEKADDYKKLASDCFKIAELLAKNMTEVGIDKIRGRCFDAVERQPYEGKVEFVWGNTKDFWQQEQAILAYLILYGYPTNNSGNSNNKDNCDNRKMYLDMAWRTRNLTPQARIST